MTRELVRSFMGYASSLCITELQILELLVDSACKMIMPPIVRSLEVVGREMQLGGVPGILYVHRIAHPKRWSSTSMGVATSAPHPRCMHFSRHDFAGDGMCSFCGRLPTRT